MPPSIIASPLPETRARSDLESRWIGYIRKNTVPSAVLCCTLPETRPRADTEFCWIDWSSSEEKLCLHRLSPVPCPRHGRRQTRSPAGLDYTRKNTVRSPVLGCTPAGDTAEVASGVPLDWLPSEEHCSINGSRLYPTGDTGEVGPRVPLDWQPSEEHCSINGSRQSPARDTAEGRPGVPLDWIY